MGNSDTEFARPRLLEGDLRRRKQADWQAGRQAGRQAGGLGLALSRIWPSRTLIGRQPRGQPAAWNKRNPNFNPNSNPNPKH